MARIRHVLIDCVERGASVAGVIPDDALLPHGGLCETTIYDRRLG